MQICPVHNAQIYHGANTPLKFFVAAMWFLGKWKYGRLLPWPLCSFVLCEGSHRSPCAAIRELATTQGSTMFYSADILTGWQHDKEPSVAALGATEDKKAQEWRGSIYLLKTCPHNFKRQYSSVRSVVLIERQEELCAWELCFVLYWQSQIMEKYSEVTGFCAWSF